MNNNIDNKKEISLCVYCKNEIPDNAKVCSICNSHQNKLRNNLIFTGKIIGYLAALAVAIVHFAAILPNARRNLFPKVDVEVLAFKSSDRVTIANKSDHEIFISHIHYESLFPKERFLEIARNLMAEELDKNPQNIKFMSNIDPEYDPFNTNKVVSKTIPKGEILNYKFTRVVPEGQTYVNNLPDSLFQRLIVFAAANYRSEYINTVFFYENDRRYLQMIEQFGKENINTFPAISSVIVYSPYKQEMVEFPFKSIGTITVSKDPIKRKAVFDKL